MEIKNRVFSTDEMGVDYYIVSLNRLYDKIRMGELLIATERVTRNGFIGLKKDGMGLDLRPKGLLKRRRRAPTATVITDENFKESCTYVSDLYKDSTMRIKYCVGMTFGAFIGIGEENFQEKYLERNPHLKPLIYDQLPKSKLKKIGETLAKLNILNMFQDRSPVMTLMHRRSSALYFTLTRCSDYKTSGTNLSLHGFTSTDGYRIFNIMYNECKKEGVFKKFHKQLDELIPIIQEKRAKKRKKIEKERNNRRRRLGFDEFMFDDEDNGVSQYEDPRTRQLPRRRNQRFSLRLDPELRFMIYKFATSYLNLAFLKAKLSYKSMKSIKKEFFELNKEKYMEFI